MARYRPLKGSSYIPLPIRLRSKHAIINVKNKDNNLFMWSILAALYPTNKNAERIVKYKDHINSINVEGISCPVKMLDIQRFEKQNKIEINVFGNKKGGVFPIHTTKQRYDKHVDLLTVISLEER
jgi:hypothetical protein